MGTDDNSRSATEAHEEAAAAAAAIKDLLPKLHGHSFAKVSSQADSLRGKRENLDRLLELHESQRNVWPKGFWGWFAKSPAVNPNSREEELLAARQEVESALADIEGKEQELREDYEALYKHYEEQTRRYSEARQRIGPNDLPPTLTSGDVPDTPAVRSLGDTSNARPTQLERLKAIAARESGRARERAWRLRKKLLRDGECVYCGGPLGDDPHADHIYPLAKGGLSVESNMVLVCESCNIRKGTDTLQTFIRAFALDRTAIERRLRAQGKDF